VRVRKFRQIQRSEHFPVRYGINEKGLAIATLRCRFGGLTIQNRAALLLYVGNFSGLIRAIETHLVHFVMRVKTRSRCRAPPAPNARRIRFDCSRYASPRCNLQSRPGIAEQERAFPVGDRDRVDFVFARVPQSFNIFLFRSHSGRRKLREPESAAGGGVRIGERVDERLGIHRSAEEKTRENREFGRKSHSDYNQISLMSGSPAISKRQMGFETANYRMILDQFSELWTIFGPTPRCRGPLPAFAKCDFCHRKLRGGGVFRKYQDFGILVRNEIGNCGILVRHVLDQGCGDARPQIVNLSQARELV